MYDSSGMRVSRRSRPSAAWTRVMAERKTQCRGELVDLVPYVLARRERLVLKPNDEYGGKGIVLGWTEDGPAWEAAKEELGLLDAVGADLDVKSFLAGETSPLFVGSALTNATQSVRPVGSIVM